MSICVEEHDGTGELNTSKMTRRSGVATIPVLREDKCGEIKQGSVGAQQTQNSLPGVLTGLS